MSSRPFRRANGAVTYGYDACGRTRTVTAGAGVTTLAYDDEDRLVSLAKPGSAATTYAYNGADARVAKAGAGGARTYRRDGVGVAAPVLSDGVSTMVPGVSERTGGASRFQHLDRLGTAARKTDASGTTVATRTYDAFGVPTQNADPASAQGYASAFGYQEDAESGLKLLGHRYYDPGAGRFLTRDPVGSGMNWYRYADNNPLKSVDPSGLKLHIVRDTDKDANGRGFTKSEYDQIQKDIAQMRKTKRGRLILDQLEKDSIDHWIEKGIGSENPATDPTWTSVRLRPDKKYLVEVDSLGSGYAPFSGARLLAHELGHVATKVDDVGTNSMDNVELNENPVAKELKQPRRTSYLWWIYDPSDGLYHNLTPSGVRGVRWP